MTALAIESRQWHQTCADCGTVYTFTGTLDDWIDAAMTFDDVHLCDAAVAS